ncbi:hypothetical protein SAICODRAFT_26712 [Saitoella complicata NRRL Y-17804]|uniref:uncharacterized protein n=1 Tax=Saitoella complicata (strain BCRC 22490 / CBS 7301 / JCM 7358 / NBRC 10748 / NRRL Y-17804) TaxID=698492 RepID=UPI000866D849|nr:uncharacterized protein SAICODRAFT_26712 [Saitoella complicata NRRL Y-17804]ODQ51631.1 hypothetical protein SAICODRAFT_26712 [Saitoella complicata NRRL Y-17804]
MYGYHPIQPNRANDSNVESAEELINKLSDMHIAAKDTIHGSQIKQKHHADRRRYVPTDFQKGDWVLVLKSNQDKLGNWRAVVQDPTRFANGSATMKIGWSYLLDHRPTQL